MSKYLSDTFFHFVGQRNPHLHGANYRTLRKVLASKQVRVPKDMPPASVSTDLAQTLLSGRLFGMSQACFAEIRAEHLDIHIAKYGHFGIGLGRELVTKFGARPVIYIPTHNTDWQGIDGKSVLKDVEAIYRGFLRHVVEPRNFKDHIERTHGVEPATEDEAISAMDALIKRYFLAYMKPFQSDLDENHERYFYAEREWRSPINVRFERRDIRVVIVHPNYLGRFVQDQPELADQCRPSDRLEQDLRQK